MIIKNTKELGNYIRTIRKNQFLTQSDIAAVSGVGVRFIVDLEKGKETCEIAKVMNVIQALGLSINIE